MIVQTIPPQAHLKLELKACYVKIQKIGDVCLSIESQHKQWAFDTLKSTQAEIKQLKIKLALTAVPFTALKFRHLKRI